MSYSIANQMELPELYTERIILRFALQDDVPAVVDYHQRNCDYLKPYSPVPPEEFFTDKFWRPKLETNIDEFHLGLSSRFFLFLQEQPEMVVGSISFSQIFRGPFHACYLGYSSDEGYQGKGYMFEGLQEAIRYAFEELSLHRIMANYIPHNQRSGKLLRRLGFVVEGYARDYLQIDGEWEDHILTSLTNENWGSWSEAK